MQVSRFTIIIVLNAALSTCESDRVPPPVSQRDSTGIAIVESTRPIWLPGQEWQVSDEPRVEIGVLEGNSDYQLFRVVGSLRLDDGSFLVANAGTQEIRWYDLAGKHIRSVGGEGEGPGEFRGLDQVVPLGSDSLLAYDSELNRVSIFSRDGTFGRTASLQGPRGFLEGVFGDGSILLTRQDAGEVSQGLSRWRTEALHYANTGELLGSLGWFPGIEWFVTIRRSGSEVRGISSESRPFGKSATFAVSGEEFYVGVQDTYEIAVHGVRGEVTALIRRAQANRPVTQRDIEAFKKGDLQEIRDVEETEERRRQLEALPYPEVMPAYGSIMTDAEGNLWVAEYVGLEGGHSYWTVFDPQRRMLGTLVTPPGLRIHQIGPDFVLGSWRDELGVAYVRCYELIKPM